MPPIRTIDRDPKQRRLADLVSWKHIYRKFPREDAYNMQNWGWHFWTYVSEPAIEWDISGLFDRDIYVEDEDSDWFRFMTYLKKQLEEETEKTRKNNLRLLLNEARRITEMW